jgi:hypothetical protein
MADAEAPPNASNCDGPHNQENLESEMQHHARATNIGDTQVGRERPELTTDVTQPLCAAVAIWFFCEGFRGGVHLHVGPVKVATLQSRIVDVWSGAEVNHKHQYN